MIVRPHGGPGRYGLAGRRTDRGAAGDAGNFGPKFEQKLPVKLTAAISQLADDREFGRWLQAALMANSLDEFRAAVGR